MRCHAGYRALPLLVVVLLTGCEYIKLLGPSVLKQLNPRVVRMVNYLPEVDDPNKATVARLFVHGGLSHADRGADGVFRDEVRVPRDEYICAAARLDRPAQRRH